MKSPGYFLSALIATMNIHLSAAYSESYDFIVVGGKFRCSLSLSSHWIRII